MGNARKDKMKSSQGNKKRPNETVKKTAKVRQRTMTKKKHEAAKQNAVIGDKSRQRSYKNRLQVHDGKSEVVRDALVPGTDYEQVQVNGWIDYQIVRDFCYSLMHRCLTTNISDDQLNLVHQFFFLYLTDQLNTELTPAIRVPRLLMQLKSLMTPRTINGVMYNLSLDSSPSASLLQFNKLSGVSSTGYYSTTTTSNTWTAGVSMRTVQFFLADHAKVLDLGCHADLDHYVKKNRYDPAFFSGFDTGDIRYVPGITFVRLSASGAAITAPCQQVVWSESKISKRNLWVACLRAFLRTSATGGDNDSARGSQNFTYLVKCPPSMLPAAIAKFGAFKAHLVQPVAVPMQFPVLKLATYLQAASLASANSWLTQSDWLALVWARLSSQFDPWQRGVTRLQYSTNQAVVPLGVANPADKSLSNITLPYGFEVAVSNLYPAVHRVERKEIYEMPLLFYTSSNFLSEQLYAFVTTSGGYTGWSSASAAWTWATYNSSRTAGNSIGTSGPNYLKCALTDPFATLSDTTTSCLNCDNSFPPLVAMYCSKLASNTVVAKVMSVEPDPETADIIMCGGVGNLTGSPTAGTIPNNLIRMKKTPINVDEMYSRRIFPLAWDGTSAIAYGRTYEVGGYKLTCSLTQAYYEAAAAEMLPTGVVPEGNKGIGFGGGSSSGDVKPIVAETPQPLRSNCNVFLKPPSGTPVRLDIVTEHPEDAKEFEKVFSEIAKLGGRARDAVDYFRSLRDGGKDFDPNDNWTGLAKLLINNLFPTYGRYGGPNYSQGRYGSRLRPGESFVDPPANLEDHYYRHHDLNYERHGRQGKQDADALLVKQLEGLDQAGKLSIYGHLAKLYFGKVAPILHLHE